MQPSRMRTFGVVESSVMPECSIPVKITLTPVHQTALSTLSWKMVHSLMTEVHADIRAHLANVGLDRLLSQKNGIVIHPLPDDFSAFDVDISIIPHATEEEVLAVRARFGEILPLTLFDASLERFLKEKERCGKSPDMGTFCNPHTEENNEENTTQRFYTIFTSVTLPGTYAEQLCALQPTQVLRLQREARLDIHDCLEHGGLAEVVPIHMIHVTPSVESGSFEVEVHAPKTIPGETYASIETCLSSHIPIPRIGTYLESVWGAADASFSGQSNPTLSPRDHQGSAQNKDSHVGRPMIIPVSMKLSISHARGLGKLAVGSLGGLRERVRADVYEHLCFHNLDRYIFLDGIKVKPVTNHEVIDVEVRNTKGNSIVPKLRAALSETIPIPSASVMLDAALRTTRLPCSGRVNPTHTQSSNEQPAARSATRVQTAAQRTRSSNNSTVSPAGTSSRGPCTYVIPYICPRLRRGPEIPERYIPSISREVVSPPPSSQQSSRSRGRSSKSMTTTH